MEGLLYGAMKGYTALFPGHVGEEVFFFLWPGYKASEDLPVPARGR